MSEDVLFTLASFVAVLALAGIAYLLGFHKDARLARSDLEGLLAAYDPDARIVDAALDAHGRAALARLADGRRAVFRALGDRRSVRVLSPSAMTLRARANMIKLSFADLGYPSLTLRIEGTPPDWLVNAPSLKM